MWFVIFFVVELFPLVFKSLLLRSPLSPPRLYQEPLSPLPILSRVAAMKVELKIPNPTSLHGCQLLDQLSCPRLITLKIRCQSSTQHNSSAQKLVKPAAELPDFGEFVACVCVGVFIIFFWMSDDVNPFTLRLCSDVKLCWHTVERPGAFPSFSSLC